MLDRSIKIFKKIVSSDAIAYAGSSMVLKGIGFFVSIWFAKVVNKTEFAKYNLFYALQTGVSTLTLAGTIEVLVGLLSQKKNDARRQKYYLAINNFTNLVAISTMSILAILSVLIFFNEFSKAMWILIAGVNGVLSSYCGFQANICRLEEKHNRSLIFNFFIPLISTLVSLIVFYYCQNQLLYFVVQSVTVGLLLILNNTIGFGVFSAKIKTKQSLVILKLAAPYQISALFSWLGGYGMIWLVQSQFSKETVAEFSFAFTASSILQLVANALNQVWNPRFYKDYKGINKSSLEKQSEIHSLKIGLLLGVTSVLMLYFLPLLQEFLGGYLTAYHSSGGLIWFSLSYCFCIPWWHVQNYFFVERRGDFLMYTVILSSAIGYLIWYFSIKLFGERALYSGFFGLTLLRSFISSIVASKMWLAKGHWKASLCGVFIIFIYLSTKI